MFNSKQELKEYIRSKVRSVLVESKQIATTYQFSPAQFKVLKDFGVKSSTSGNELFIPELVYIDLQKNRKDSKFKQDMYDTVPPSDEYLVSQILTGLKKSLNTGKTANIKDQKHFILSGTLTKNGNFNFLNPYRKEQPKEKDQPIDEPTPIEEPINEPIAKAPYKRWTEDALSQEAAKYSSKGELQQNNPAAYLAAFRAGLLNKLFPDNIRKVKWTEDALSREAAKYSSKSEFAKNNPNAYRAAVRLNLTNKLFPNRLNVKWTEDTVSQEAAKYSSRGEFAKNNSSAYIAALRLDLMNKLFPKDKKDQNIPTPTPNTPNWLSLFKDTDFLEEVNKYRK